MCTKIKSVSLNCELTLESNSLSPLQTISTANVDVVCDNSLCRHSGDNHGSAYHTGNGWCYWCKYCNPSNKNAY